MSKKKLREQEDQESQPREEEVKFLKNLLELMLQI